MTQLKTAEDPMIGAAASPVPAPQISTLAAPGKRGPVGMAPRVSNSRVNTGVAPAMDSGASEQKSIAPTGASMLQVKTAQQGEDRMATVMGRPSIQDMIQAAVAGSAERMSVNAEAMHQMKLAAEKCDKCEKSPCVCEEKKASAKLAPVENEKTASTHVEKVAAALEYAALCVKEGSIHIDGGTSHGIGPGEGPGALHVMESPGGPPPGGTNMGTAIPKNIPPKNPPMQKGLTGPVGGGVSLMKNDLDHAPGGPGHQHTALPNMKTGSAPMALILAKTAELKKAAEDALNPAQISAGRTVPPDTRESGQAGPPSPHGASMVASSQSVTNLTRRDAKAGPKADMHAYLNQPALTAEGDKVLQNAFVHTGQAGAKIASADGAEAMMKTAAVRAYLEKLVNEVKTATGGK